MRFASEGYVVSWVYYHPTWIEPLPTERCWKPPSTTDEQGRITKTRNLCSNHKEQSRSFSRAHI